MCNAPAGPYRSQGRINAIRGVIAGKKLCAKPQDPCGWPCGR